MFNIKETADNFKAKAKETNETILNTSSEVVDETLAAGKEWQTVFAKALNTGITIFGQQQEVALTTLEGIRDHFSVTNKRFRKLFGIENIDVAKEVKKAKKAVVKKADKVAEKATKEVAKAKKEVVKAKKEAVKTTEKVVAKTAKTVAKATTAANDLKVIDGIGPKMEQVLNKFGIKTYADLAKYDAAKLKDQLVATNARYAMYEPKEWIAEAANFVK